MKQIISIILAVLLVLWYAGINNEVEHEHTSEVILSPLEIKCFDEQGIFKTPINFSMEYFTTHKIAYVEKRTFIPFVYSRDTIYDNGREFYRRDK